MRIERPSVRPTDLLTDRSGLLSSIMGRRRSRSSPSVPTFLLQQRERSLTQWLAPLCLPMLMAIQPLTDLRTCVALAVLAFVVWFHYKRRRSAKRSWLGGVEKVCEKCERAMLAQLATQCRPQVGYTVRSLRKVPWRILSR